MLIRNTTMPVAMQSLLQSMRTWQSLAPVPVTLNGRRVT
jgi:hypothetical protein